MLDQFLRLGIPCTFLIHERRDTLIIQTTERNGEDGVVRIPFLSETGAAYQVDDPEGVVQFGHFIAGVRIDEVRRPLEVTGPDILRSQGQFETVGLHGCDVTVLDDLTADTLGVGPADEVEVVTLIPVPGEIDAVVEEAQFHAHVELMLLFEGELRVGQVIDREDGLPVVHIVAPGIFRHDDHIRVGDPGRTAFRRQGVGKLEGCMGKDGLEATHEGFITDVPAAGNVPGRKPAGRARLAQTVGALVADGPVQTVLVHQRISGRPEERRPALMGVDHRIVLGVILGALLEHLVIVIGDFAHAVLHAPAAEPGLVTVHGVDFHTGVRVHGVNPAKGLGEIGGQTGIPAEHLVVGALVDTAHGQDGLRNSEGDVRIGV